jgi:hypothetical protein
MRPEHRLEAYGALPFGLSNDLSEPCSGLWPCTRSDEASPWVDPALAEIDVSP